MKKSQQPSQTAARSCPSGSIAGQISSHEDLIRRVREEAARISASPETARAYLLSTGFYTKKLRLKKKFR